MYVCCAHLHTTLQQLNPLQWLPPLSQLVQHYQHKQTQSLQYLLLLPLQWVLPALQLPHLHLQQKPLLQNQSQNHHEQEQDLEQQEDQEVKQEQEVEQEVKQEEVEPRVLEAEQELRTQELQEGREVQEGHMEEERLTCRFTLNRVLYIIIFSHWDIYCVYMNYISNQSLSYLYSLKVAIKVIVSYYTADSYHISGNPIGSLLPVLR